MCRRLLALAGILLLCGQARAQLGVPALRLPGGLLNAPLGDVTRLQGNDPLDSQQPEQLRRARVRELLRRYPRLIEADPAGAPIVRGELLLFDPSDALLDRARAAGFELRRQRTLDALGARLVVLGAPSGVATAQARERLRAFEPSADFNHLYLQSAGVPVPSAAVQPLAAATADASAPSPTAARVGLIDDGVDTRHAVFEGVRIEQHGCAIPAAPGAHGTAVASLLVGHLAQFHGAAAGAQLYAADVYCGSPTGGATDAIVDALAWLARERVAVINVSLVGPANAMLERAVQSLIARGHVIVAAVGNDGPAAPPLYPAAYPQVVGVTAVDARRHVLLEAERGPQVTFAAPGADMAAARTPRGFRSVRGTSFAAPLVAGVLALQLPVPDPQAARVAITQLAARAIDLGSPGRDPVYGFGLVAAELRPAPALASR
ncbi:MAG TPA: S8 family serine peptidase [Steroidobacteraceae bacterium]|nr:S8 family serine peptidase [Steroidobacteraceae bacterium]